jgi:TM2 domain-containing membrane protein YozV
MTNILKDKTIATVLAFFLGGLGVHKFYLGETTGGILYLIFCWTLIPGILAFFDFIGLLITSDQAFNIKYNPHLIPSNTNESSHERIITLKELKQLYDSGIITAEEYEQKRRKYLDSL